QQVWYRARRRRREELCRPGVPAASGRSGIRRILGPWPRAARGGLRGRQLRSRGEVLPVWSLVLPGHRALQGRRRRRVAGALLPAILQGDALARFGLLGFAVEQPSEVLERQ